MSSNWDRFNEAIDLPYFTLEEQARVDKVFKKYQERYDPIGAKARRSKTWAFPKLKREQYLDLQKKIRDAENA